jgi:hypothetical protein
LAEVVEAVAVPEQEWVVTSMLGLVAEAEVFIV